MDIAAILIKLTGVLLFLWTSRSIYKHFRDKSKNDEKKEKQQSLSEQVFNSILLYVWHLFMFAFSLGMIFNN